MVPTFSYADRVRKPKSRAECDAAIAFVSARVQSIEAQIQEDDERGLVRPEDVQLRRAHALERWRLKLAELQLLATQLPPPKNIQLVRVAEHRDRLAAALVTLRVEGLSLVDAGDLEGLRKLFTTKARELAARATDEWSKEVAP